MRITWAILLCIILLTVAGCCCCSSASPPDATGDGAANVDVIIEDTPPLDGAGTTDGAETTDDTGAADGTQENTDGEATP